MFLHAEVMPILELKTNTLYIQAFYGPDQANMGAIFSDFPIHLYHEQQKFLNVTRADRISKLGMCYLW